MAASNLLALIDDIATLLDDVAVMSKVAVKKTAGVLGDDLALNAQQVTGISADRELPVVWAVAKGSLVNKAILVPAALGIGVVAPWAIPPLLMVGGLFLCYEGCEKLAHKFLGGKEEEQAHHRERLSAVADPAVDLVAYEKEKIKGAVRTDFILSAEIVVITLGSLAQASPQVRVLTLVSIALMMTVGVYGLVAAIVKLDDLGRRLHGGAAPFRQRLGAAILWSAPYLMRGLSIAGTAAMFLVGGGILVHGIPPLHHFLESALGPLSILGEMAFGILAGAVVLGSVTTMTTASKSAPRGPKSLFGLDNVKAFSDNTLEFILGLHRKYGDTVRFRMGPFVAYFFYHPDQVREILTTHWKKLPKMERQVKVLRQWDGNGLLLSEGEYWQRQHRLVQPAFAAKRFGGYADVMVELTGRLLSRWEASGDGGEILIDEQMRYLTLDIISKTMFGADVSMEKNRELERAVLALSEISVDEMKRLFIPPLWLPTAHNRRKRRAMELLDSTIRGFIKARRESGKDAGDLLSMLLLAVDEDGDRGGMSDEQARDEVMVLFLAGHDTTATGLVWTWYLLGTHPDVEQRVVDEVDRVLGGKTPTYEDLGKLKYLRQVIQESLRLYPPAIGTFAREPVEDLVIGGTKVPKGSFVYTFCYATHRDPRWFPDPERFDPERFSPEREKTIPSFAYFPFGGGPRACIGMTFALMEMTAVIATTLQRYRLHLVSGLTVLSTVRLSLTPQDPIRIRLQKRK